MVSGTTVRWLSAISSGSGAVVVVVAVTTTFVLPTLPSPFSLFLFSPLPFMDAQMSFWISTDPCHLGRTAFFDIFVDSFFLVSPQK